MFRIRSSINRIETIVIVIVLATAALLSVAVPPVHVHADVSRFPNRKLYVDEPFPGVVTTYRVSLTIPGSATYGSILMDFCTDSLWDAPCIGPTGLDVSAAVLSAQSGPSNFSILSQTTNRIILTRPASVLGVTPTTFTFTNVTNPSALTTGFFIKMSSYASTDATGPFIDYGAVGASIVNQVNINTEVPPLLVFCVGIQIIGNCSSSTGNFIDLGLLVSDQTRFGSTEMVVATNADFGFSIGIIGGTMTAGNKIIEAMETPGPSMPGTAQFGLNMADNTNPDVGADPVGSGTGVLNSAYTVPDEYLFDLDGDTLITSGTTSDYTKYTTSYIVNVTPDQPYGIYNTTVTYICTATF